MKMRESSHAGSERDTPPSERNVSRWRLAQLNVLLSAPL